MLVGTQVVQSAHKVPLVLPRTQVERRLLTEMVTVGGGMVLSQQSQRGPDADSEEEEAAVGVEEHQLGPTNLVVMGRHAQQQALLKRLAREGVPAVRCVHSRLPSRAGGHLRAQSFLCPLLLTCRDRESRLRLRAQGGMGDRAYLRRPGPLPYRIAAHLADARLANRLEGSMARGRGAKAAMVRVGLGALF